jgi:hypothetical protein
MADHILISPEIDPIGFRVIREDLSDHYGLELEFEIADKHSQPLGGLGAINNA